MKDDNHVQGQLDLPGSVLYKNLYPSFYFMKQPGLSLHETH